MTSRHPIVPSLELVHQWDEEGTKMFRPEYQIYLTTRAAQWGADQELEACCEWLEQDWEEMWAAEKLRAARRPKPPNLKKLALAVMSKESWSIEDQEIIRRALEALPND